MGEIQGDGTKHPSHVVLSFNQIWSLELPNFLCKTPKFCAQEGDRANRCGGNILESQKLLDWKEPWEAVSFNLPLRAKSALTDISAGFLGTCPVKFCVSPRIGNLFLVYNIHMVIFFLFTSNQNFPCWYQPPPFATLDMAESQLSGRSINFNTSFLVKQKTICWIYRNLIF